MTSSTTLATDADEKPAWANWIEAEENKQWVVGVECRSCNASVTEGIAKAPHAYQGLWNSIDHAETCFHGE